MASELRVNTLKDASGNNSIATSFVAGGSAKAWINFNGQSTLAARDSFNIASLTDNGTGDYTPAFTSSMGNGDYALGTFAAGNNSVNTNSRAFGSGTKATGNHQIRIGYVSNTAGGLTLYDSEANDIVYQGDLA